MRLLVLGGTGFLGYHAVAAALGAGHEVSTFTREGEAVLEGVEPLAGDRRGDLSALRGREWDAALDTFSDPEAVTATVRLLSGSVGAYGFVSGISNYHPEGPRVVDEDAPLRGPGEAAREDPLQERSIAKLRGEEAVRDGFPGGSLIVRPGIMVGPRDPSDRFTWWPVRFLRGGEVLAPGNPERAVQFTDARDLAAWMVRMLDAGETGTFNAVGPGRKTTLAQVLEACRTAANDVRPGEAEPARITWVGEGFLEDSLREIPEEGRPLWFPERQIPFEFVDSTRALGAGLRFRPVLDTARDTLRWLLSRGRGAELDAGWSPEFERGLLDAWRARPG